MTPLCQQNNWGEPNPPKRPRRGIAGTLIWTNFDRHALLDLVSKLAGTFIANADDIRPQFRTDENAFLSQNAIFNSTLVRDTGLPVDATIDSLSGVRMDDTYAVPSRC